VLGKKEFNGQWGRRENIEVEEIEEVASSSSVFCLVVFCLPPQESALALLEQKISSVVQQDRVRCEVVG
jgi:hypothetical protein